jgi:putative hydroxymethylpyrimidine transport system substrate-binding protein
MNFLPGLALAALVATSAVAQTPDQPENPDQPEKLTVMLDWFVNPDHGPLVIAQELGYFADAGLDVELIAPADPNAPPRMAAAGRVNIAVTYQPELHLNLHAGLPLVRVGTLIATPLTCLVVRGDGPVQTMRDLEGRRVGFAVAGMQEALLTAMLAHNGLAPDAVERINIGWSISPALMSGQVDAVIGAYRNFELNQMRLEGIEGRCFYPEEEGVPAYDELIYVANPETMAREKVARFLKATEKAVQYILNHPKDAWEIFAGTSAELRTDLNELAWGDTYPRFATRPAAMDAGRYATFEAFLLNGGLYADGSAKALAVGQMAVDVTAGAD